MDIIDHGEWQIYEPDRYPFAGIQQRVMFCRRVSDQRDWYDFQKELRNDNIKMTVDATGTVMATHRDPSFLFPGNMRLIEIASDEEHESFRRKILSLDNKAFLPPREPKMQSALSPDDPFLRAFARELGMSDERLRQLFDSAKET